MDLLPIQKISTIKPGNYIVLRFRGLFGDMISSMARIQPIINKYPDASWIILHDYHIKDRIQASMDILKYWIDNGKIKYYFYSSNGSFPIHPLTIVLLKSAGITEDRIFNLNVFQGKPNPIICPNLGIKIPEQKDAKKAIILRYSGYHGHFPKRNRPIEEWSKIEKMLLDKGYTVYLLGKDDTMPNPNNLIDLRGKLSIREVLEFSSDASLCVCVTTFLYTWTQFVCPTMTLSDSGDVQGLDRYWKLHDNLQIADVGAPDYLETVKTFINNNTTN